MRILVVEDDQLLNKTLSYNLSAVGYSVDGAMSKAVAIRFLEKQDYDLIVLDVNLPDGNGFDICREVKERRPDTAVIFLTANDMESDMLKEIYIVELIVSSICAMVLFIADITSVFISSNIAGLEFSDKVNITEFAFHAAIAFVCIITVSALYTMIVMISHKQLISLGIAVILTLALLTLGGKSVSSLNQSSTWTDPITHEIVENPLRIDSFARTANNIHVLVSPFAQAKFHSYLLSESEFGTKEETSLIFKDFPYHIEFCLFNILEFLLFYKVGIRIFRKQDLK